MEITEVRISRRTDDEGKLKGYAAVTFDDVFVVRDLKIIEGKKGLFVAMPSQKIQAPCSKCRKKNAIRSKFCNECGCKLPIRDRNRRELHRDISHPVNSDMRTYLQKVIIEAYQANDTKSYDDDGADDYIENGTSSDEILIDSPKKIFDAPKKTDDYLSTPSLNAEERITSFVSQEEESNELLDTIEK